MKPIAISLFSGAGGMDIGMRDAGFDVRACVEIDPSCCETLRHNLADAQIIEGDIQTLSGAEILHQAGLNETPIDLIFGGPPCQSFSLAGKREGLSDARGALIYDFVRIVRELRPKSFVMENVKGMANWEKGLALKEIKKLFQNDLEETNRHDGYTVSHAILNAADFGVPQKRERIFIVGVRGTKSFDFPHVEDFHTGGGPKTVADAICNLPKASQPSDTALRVSKSIKGRIENHGY